MKARIFTPAAARRCGQGAACSLGLGTLELQDLNPSSFQPFRLKSPRTRSSVCQGGGGSSSNRCPYHTLPCCSKYLPGSPNLAQMQLWGAWSVACQDRQPLDQTSGAEAGASPAMEAKVSSRDGTGEWGAAPCGVRAVSLLQVQGPRPLSFTLFRLGLMNPQGPRRTHKAAAMWQGTDGAGSRTHKCLSGSRILPLAQPCTAGARVRGGGGLVELQGTREEGTQLGAGYGATGLDLSLTDHTKT